MTINTTSPPTESQPGHPGLLALAGLAGLLLLGLPGTTYAQDSSSMRQQDTTQASTRAESTSTDSSKWGYNVERNPSEQNPQGYRGMERPAGLSDSAVADSSAPDDATSRVNQMKRQDSIGQAGNAANKPATGKKHAKTKSKQQSVRDSSSQDSTKWGYKVDRNPKVQNPPGYRGMERPAGLDSVQKANQKQGAAAGQNGSQSGNRDSMQSSNPDSMQSSKRDSMQSGNAESGHSGGQAAAGSDTTSTVRMGQDSTGDSTRFGVNAQEQSSRNDRSANRDSVDVIHRERQVAPGVAHQPPPYPADSERAWVQERPGNDSVSLRSGESSSDTSQNSR